MKEISDIIPFKNKVWLSSPTMHGQIPYLREHIAQKKAIYERYKEGLKDLPVSMNPYDAENSRPNFWLSCMLIDPDAMAPMVRSDREYLYQSVQQTMPDITVSGQQVAT